MRLISSELQSLVDTPQINTSVNVNVYGGTVQPGYVGQVNNTIGVKNLLLSYIKRRAYAIVIIVVVLMLLVTTSLFTDFGLNIGQYVYNQLSSFLGF
jgi:hypothetical protein